MANRLWHDHFGRGIVPTPSDFGCIGLPPSPELLDWLTSELIGGGWHLKRMHRLIMLSNTYQQPSQIDNQPAVSIDPDTALVWGQNMRRSEVEAPRASILTVTGRLNLAMGGRGVFSALPAEVLATVPMGESLKIIGRRCVVS